jgi:hypothetical protein
MNEQVIGRDEAFSRRKDLALEGMPPPSLPREVGEAPLQEIL